MAELKYVKTIFARELVDGDIFDTMLSSATNISWPVFRYYNINDKPHYTKLLATDAVETAPQEWPGFAGDVRCVLLTPKLWHEV